MRKLLNLLSNSLPKQVFSCYFFIIAFTISISSCDNKNIENKEKGTPVARVYDKYLYTTDIQSLVSQSVSQRDSAKIVQHYIDNWVQEQVVVQKARENLGSQEAYIRRKTTDYESSLVMYLYERELIEQKLDTTVERSEMREYLSKYQASFLLENTVFHLVMLQFAGKSPIIDSAKYWLNRYNEDAKVYLDGLCEEGITTCLLQDSTWKSYDEISEVMPLKWYKEKDLLSRKWVIEIIDKKGVFLLKILGSRIKGKVAPLSYVEKDIRSIILNKRKKELIKNIREKLYQEALKKSEFEIYN